MERRQHTRGFKLEAVRLIRDRGVSYAQASRDLGVHHTMLTELVKAFGDDPQHAFPGHGQLKPEQAEIARLKREVTKLKAERDIPKKPRPTSRRNRREVRLHREAPGGWPGERQNLRGEARVARHAGGGCVVRIAPDRTADAPAGFARQAPSF